MVYTSLGVGRLAGIAQDSIPDPKEPLTKGVIREREQVCIDNNATFASFLGK